MKFLIILLILIICEGVIMGCDDIITCRTNDDVEKAYGQQCIVVGTYDIKPFRTKKEIIFVHWPVLVLSDSTIVLLESFWKHKDGRSLKERRDLIGKLVKVKGILHIEPPTDEGAQNIAIPCISPVEQINLVKSK